MSFGVLEVRMCRSRIESSSRGECGSQRQPHQKPTRK